MRVQVQQQQQQQHGGQGGTAWGAQAQVVPSSVQRANPGSEGVVLQVRSCGWALVILLDFSLVRLPYGSNRHECEQLPAVAAHSRLAAS
jgi:hypothetical protein